MMEIALCHTARLLFKLGIRNEELGMMEIALCHTARLLFKLGMKVKTVDFFVVEIDFSVWYNDFNEVEIVENEVA